MHRFKYQGNLFLKHEFTRLMICFLETHQFDIKQFDLIMPVPLHPAKMRERGFNQSEILAQIISKKYDIPLYNKSLIRVKNTKTQTLLDQKERWTNLKGAFRIKHSKNLNFKNILIIDDLLTTGATVSEAGRMLKLAGAGTVGVLTLAIVK
ncbi:MAG: ComF family protein [Candidatus Omnitrophica bacterium]|nr:ComF family protein [Candidatus Omnitrophota bacterium]